MAYTVEKVDVWKVFVPDSPGSLAMMLESLKAAGVNLEFLFARQHDAKRAIAFVAPVQGAAQVKAAKAAGFSKFEQAPSLRIEGADKPGIGRRIARILGDNGINIRGLSAMALGKRALFYVALPKADVAKAKRLLQQAL